MSNMWRTYGYFESQGGLADLTVEEFFAEYELNEAPTALDAAILWASTQEPSSYGFDRFSEVWVMVANEDGGDILRFHLRMVPWARQESEPVSVGTIEVEEEDGTPVVPTTTTLRPAQRWEADPDAFGGHNPYKALAHEIASVVGLDTADGVDGPVLVEHIRRLFETERTSAELRAAKLVASQLALGHLPLDGALRELNRIGVEALQRWEEAIGLKEYQGAACPPGVQASGRLDAAVGGGLDTDPASGDDLPEGSAADPLRELGAHVRGGPVADEVGCDSGEPAMSPEEAGGRGHPRTPEDDGGRPGTPVALPVCPEGVHGEDLDPSGGAL